MARVQLIIADQDHGRFVQQARREGLTFSAWLRAAAHYRLEERQRSQRFESPEQVGEFFRMCDTLEGSGTEPDWEEHLRVIDESRRRGFSGT